MYFAKPIAAFVALTAFATSTIAAPTKAPPKAAAKAASGPLVAGSGVFAKVKATKAAWDKAAQLCAGGKKKRDLEDDDELWSRAFEDDDELWSRAFEDDDELWSRAAPPGYTDVAMGKADSYGAIPIGLWTEGLVTCFGVAIVGKGSKDTRFLLHSTASSTLLGWDELEKKVKAAGLTSADAWVSTPSTTSNTPPGFTADDKKLNEDMAAAIEEKVKALIGKAPKVVKHTMVPASNMQVAPDGKVSVNGHQV